MADQNIDKRYLFGDGTPSNTPARLKVRHLVNEWNERYHGTTNSAERSLIVDFIISAIGEENFQRQQADGTIFPVPRSVIKTHLQTKFSHKKGKTRTSAGNGNTLTREQSTLLGDPLCLGEFGPTDVPDVASTPTSSVDSSRRSSNSPNIPTSLGSLNAQPPVQLHHGGALQLYPQSSIHAFAGASRAQMPQLPIWQPHPAPRAGPPPPPQARQNDQHRVDSFISPQLHTKLLKCHIVSTQLHVFRFRHPESGRYYTVAELKCHCHSCGNDFDVFEYDRFIECPCAHQDDSSQYSSGPSRQGGGFGGGSMGANGPNGFSGAGGSLPRGFPPTGGASSHSFPQNNGHYGEQPQGRDVTMSSDQCSDLEEACQEDDEMINHNQTDQEECLPEKSTGGTNEISTLSDASQDVEQAHDLQVRHVAESVMLRDKKRLGLASPRHQTVLSAGDVAPPLEIEIPSRATNVRCQETTKEGTSSHRCRSSIDHNKDLPVSEVSVDAVMDHHAEVAEQSPAARGSHRKSKCALGFGSRRNSIPYPFTSDLGINHPSSRSNDHERISVERKGPQVRDDVASSSKSVSSTSASESSKASDSVKRQFSDMRLSETEALDGANKKHKLQHTDLDEKQAFVNPNSDPLSLLADTAFHSNTSSSGSDSKGSDFVKRRFSQMHLDAHAMDSMAIEELLPSARMTPSGFSSRSSQIGCNENSIKRQLSVFSETGAFDETIKRQKAMIPDGVWKGSEASDRFTKQATAVMREMSFPEKLYQLLLEAELQGQQGIVSWTSDGETFRIHNWDRFTEDIAPKYFRHPAISSFKSKLNAYGFELIATGSAQVGYSHEYFLKDKPDLCRQIQRSNKWGLDAPDGTNLRGVQLLLRNDKIIKAEAPYLQPNASQRREKVVIGNHCKSMQYPGPDVIWSHSDSVRGCAQSNDGSRFLSASHDKTMQIWERQNDGQYQCLQTLDGRSSQVYCCAMWNDGQNFVSGTEAKTLKVWGPKSDGKYHCIQTVGGHSGWVTCCAVWNNGHCLLSGSTDNTVKVWELNDGQYSCIHTLKGHSGDVNCLGVWDDGRYLLSGSWDHTLKVWRYKNGGCYECIQTLREHSDRVNCCAVLKNGRYLLSGSADKTLKLWEKDAAGNFMCIQNLQGHTSFVNCVSIWKDGCRLLSGSHDKTLKVWKRGGDGQYRCVHTLQGDAYGVLCCSMSDNSLNFLSGGHDRTLKVWRLEAPEEDGD